LILIIVLQSMICAAVIFYDKSFRRQVGS